MNKNHPHTPISPDITLDIPSESEPASMHDQSQEIRDYTTTVTILESITDAIFILSSSGNIEYANRSAQDYLQFSLQEIIGQKLDTFFSSEDMEAWQILSEGIGRGDLDAISNHELFSNSEVELNGSQGAIPVLINFSIIPDSLGKLKYIIVTAKEITYRKSLEKELKNRQALSVSFDRLKALGEMSVGLVHTLGQPVTAMELRLDHILQLEDLDAIKAQVTDLQKDMEKLSGIVDKVRSYAQSMDNKQIQKIDINKNIHSIISVLEYEIRAANISLELSLTEMLPSIDANEPELEQVFINLVTNSIQAFEVNQIDVLRNIEISSRSMENKWIEVSILDNAGGIPGAILPLIFEPFFSTWDKDKHAGTGLSVARSIVTSLGGDLNAKIVPGGTKFIVRIPVTQVEERTQLINLIELLNS